MQIKFSLEEGKAPYQVQYLGYTLPPIHPRLGIPRKGYNTTDYGCLLKQVTEDMKYFPDNVELVFDGIPKELQDITKVVFDLAKENNKKSKKLEKIVKAVLE